MDEQHRDDPGRSGEPAGPDLAGTEAAEHERRQFRAWVRASHPDAGGDPEAFAAGLAQWRARQAALVPAAPPPVTVFRSRGGLWLLQRWWTRWLSRGGPRRVR